MDQEWNDGQPIYRQLRDRVVAMILDGVLQEGDPLPSVRNVAAEYRVNPLTVLKSYQGLGGRGVGGEAARAGHVHQSGARELIDARANARNFWRNNGRGYTRRFSGWD